MNFFIEFLNRFGDLFLSFAARVLLQSSIVMLVIFALDWFWLDRVRAVVRYALWLLVLAKFLLPPSLALPTSPAYWFRQQTPLPPLPLATFVAHEFSSTPVSSRIDAAGTFIDTAPAPPPGPRLTKGGVAAFFSALVAAALLLVLMQRARTVRRIISCGIPPADSLRDLLDSCASQMRVHRPVLIRLSDAVPSPALCGLLRPMILMPKQLADKLPALQLRAVLLHELAHFKRGDLWVSHVQTLLQIVYWWHPLLWLANARIRRVREEAVDETVLVTMAQEADAYPETLLNVAKLGVQGPRLAFGLLGIMECKSTLGQRIRRMLSQPLPRSARIGLAGTVVVMAAAVILLPMARAAKEPAKSSTAPATQPAAVTNQGKTVAQWFDQYDFNSNITYSNQVVAMRAIREMGTNAVPFLREKLTAPSAGKRFQRSGDDPRIKSAWILSNLGATAEGVLNDLIQALNDDETTALYAADAIGNIGPKARIAVPALFESLRFGNGRAAKALVAIAPDHPDLVPTLIDVLKNGNDQDRGQPRINAAMALGRLGNRATAAVPALREALKSRDCLHFASQALRRIAPDRSDVMAEVDAAVQQLAPPPLPPITELIDQARSGDSNQRRQAIENLGHAVAMARFKGTPVSKEQIRDQILPLLSEALDNEDPAIARAAGGACSGLGPYAEPLLDKLLKLAEKDGPARGNVIGSLLQVAPGDRRTLPLLVRALDDVIPHIRQNAAAVLREFGPEAREAVPGLQKLLNDSEPWVRFNASITLWNIARQPPSIPFFLERLKEDDNGDFVPLAVCKLFGEMGPPAKEGLPALRELLSHWNPKVREQARAALGKVNPNDPALLEKQADKRDEPKTEISASVSPSGLEKSPARIPPALGPSLRKLRSRDKDTRLEALEELGRKGAESREAIPFLTPLLNQADAEIRAYVAAMLADIDPDGSQVVQPLVDALKDRDQEVRAAALLSLRKLRPKTRTVLEVVKLALKDDTEALGKLAAESIVVNLAGNDSASPGSPVRDSSQKNGPVVQLQVRFISIKPGATGKLQLRGHHAERTDGLLKAILDPGELSSFIEQAEKASGVDILAAPPVTTPSGHAAQISMGEVVGGTQPNSPSESVFAVNAVGYFVKTNVTNPNLEPTGLVGPSMVISPKVSGEKIELTLTAQITEGSNRGLKGKSMGVTNADGIRTNFFIRAEAEISSGMGIVLQQHGAKLQDGSEVLLLISAQLAR